MMDVIKLGTRVERVAAGIRAAQTGPSLSIDLHLPEQGLSQLNTTIVAPLDHSIILVRLLNSAYYATRLSEVSLDAISGHQFPVGGQALTERRLAGAV